MSIKSLVEQWLAWDRNEETRSAIQTLWEAGDEGKLKALLGRRMRFGTAGLRARMGAGNAQMNPLTVIQAAQGLAAHLVSQFSETDLATRGVVVGFDGRHNSLTFAKLTVTAMRARRIRTYLYDRVTPTPFVPFAIRHYRCVGGVMVTASHNPKQDNGYKVYWCNGAQITSPRDKEIAASIEANLEPWEGAWVLGRGDVNPFSEINQAYFGSLRQHYTPLGRAPTDGGRKDLQFAYSAMHGVGYRFARDALMVCGVPAASVHSTKEQEEPDPNFPTVEFPNPEEGKGSLGLALRTAARTGASVVLANDPDADRLAVAEKQPKEGSWHVFTGNEIGALLGWWAVHHARRRGDELDRCYFLSSTVSSPILDSIARKEGLRFRETLTGFKWMGTLAEQLAREGTGRVLLAFEEAIGFMWGDRVFDKDGVTAAGVMADMARYLWAEEGCTLHQKLLSVYQVYGYHFSSNSYVLAPDPAKVLLALRNIATKENGHYPTTVAKAKVKGVRDLSNGLDTRVLPDHKATLPTSPKSPILTFYLDNGVTFTVRGSGTEPKLKWYTSLVTSDPNGQLLLARFVRAAVDELIQPEAYGFQRRRADLPAASAL